MWSTVAKFDRSQIDVREFLETLGVSNISKVGNEFFYSCPFPGHKHGDSNPSASMQEGTTWWKCFGCGRHGDAVAFLSMHEGVSPLVALGWLQGKYGGDFIYEEGALTKIIGEILTPAEQELPPEEPQPIIPNWYDIDWGKAADSSYMNDSCALPGYIRYMFMRGFRSDILDCHDIGWDPISDRIVIPFKNVFGEIIGAKGRAWKEGDSPRYKVLGGKDYGFEPVKIGNVVYGIHCAIDNVLLMEGELNAMSAEQKGFAALATSGSNLSDRQATIIRRLVKDVTIIYDGDEAGYRGALEAAAKLSPYMTVRINFNDPEHDISDMTEDELGKLVDEAKSWSAYQVESILAR